jgi:hypothetical protein
MSPFPIGNAGWRSFTELPNKNFDCGFCGKGVSSIKGYIIGQNRDGAGAVVGGAWLCSNCLGPNAFAPDGSRFPTPALGNPVAHVPDTLNMLYEEARRCTSANCYTAAVLLCRKMLMNIAVQEGAAEGLKFIEYVAYLSNKGYVPPNGKHWVDHIRKRGNEATHEIALMSETDAKELVGFLEMLLRFIYEFPNLVPKGSP